MICLLIAVPAIAFAQQTFTMNLWVKKAPNKNGDASDSAKVMVFLPEKKKSNGQGSGHLSWWRICRTVDGKGRNRLGGVLQ